MSLGRYLTPGRKVLVRVFSVRNPNEAAELKGRIAWCRPTEQPERFLAGVEIFYDAPEVSEDLSRLMLEAALAHADAAAPVSFEEPEQKPARVRIRMRFPAGAVACAGCVKAMALATTLLAVRSGA
jgi:hypothetical protein